MEEDYYSAKLLMSMAQKEYDIENDRRKTLDTRIGIFISLTSALLFFIMNNITQVTVYSEHFKLINQVVLYVFFIISLICLIFSLLISLYFYIKVISTTKYKRLDIEEFLDETKNLENTFAQVITIVYKDIIKYNRRENDIKFEYFKKGLVALKISLSALVVTYLLIFISKL